MIKRAGGAPGWKTVSIDFRSGVVRSSAYWASPFCVPFGIQEPQSVDFAALSPSFWPRLVCIGLAVMGAFIAVAAYLNRNQPDEGEAEEPSQFPMQVIVLRIALALGMMFAAYFMLEPLGFVITGMLVLVAFMIFAGERNPNGHSARCRRCAAVSVSSFLPGSPTFRSLTACWNRSWVGGSRHVGSHHQCLCDFRDR